MDIFWYWVLWVFAVSFNLLVVSFIAIFFLKGHQERLHYFQEYSEDDTLFIPAFRQRKVRQKDRDLSGQRDRDLSAECVKAHVIEESISKKKKAPGSLTPRPRLADTE